MANWQERFLELYMSKETADFSAALKLKREHIPKRLYRYRGTKNLPHLLEEICDGEIFLAHPKDVNDPFDSRSLMKSEEPSHYFTNRQPFRDAAMDHFDPDTLEQIFQKEDWFHAFTALVARESASDKVEEQEAMVRAFEHVIMEQLLHVNKAFNDMVYKISRFACFTTKSDNLPMWNHYAQGYTGVCLEYDTAQITNIYTVNRLFPVYYVDVLPDMPEMSLGKAEPPFGLMDYFLVHKLKDWSYEDEWRLIYNVGSWYFSLEDTPEAFWDNGKTIPFLRPSRILLGPKIDSETEAFLRQACAPYLIPVVKMECTEYGLREAAEAAIFC